jgi:hypothetical protein
MRKLASLVLVLFAATAALANSHTEMKPSDKLRDLDYFGGNWSCKGMAMASPMAPEHPTEGTVMAKWEGGNYWLGFTYAETKTAKNPMPFWVKGFFGWDLEQQKFVIGGVDNMGGYSTSASAGWVGDTITFEGPWHMMGMTVTGRDMFVKKSATSMTHSAWIDDKGTWTKLDEENCTKGK